jgi:hypothetical protein
MKVNYVDILLYTAKMLKAKYPTYNIYVDDNEQVITIPSFFIEVIPMKTEEKLDKTKYKIVNLLIEYVDRKALKQDKLQIIDDLNDLIGKGISVIRSDGKSRTLPVFDKKPTIADMAIMLVTLEYYDGLAEPVTLEDDRSYDELMGILNLNTKETTT